MFKTFNVPSFFAGVATVLALLTVGFGGGVMMSGMLSDTSHKPNKIERQAAKDTTEARPTSTPAIPPPVAPVATATEPATQTKAAPVQGQVQSVPEAPSNSVPPAATVSAQPTPQPDQAAAPAQSVPQPVAAPGSPPPQAQPSTPPSQTAQTPAFGPQKSVSLVQPPREPQFDPSQLSRREQARYWRYQRREERAQRREERRKQFAERHQQEQVRRDEMQSGIERARPRDADDDDEPSLVPMRPRRLFDGLFGGRRNDDD